jgi:hypothetical protein
MYTSDKHYSNVFRLLLLHVTRSLWWVPKDGKLQNILTTTIYTKHVHVRTLKFSCYLNRSMH